MLGLHRRPRWSRGFRKFRPRPSRLIASGLRQSTRLSPAPERPGLQAFLSACDPWCGLCDDHEISAEESRSPEPCGRYESPVEYTFKADAEGRFGAERLPGGTATTWLHRPGYRQPGLGPPIGTPGDDVALRMMKAASVRVTGDFAGMERPAGYIVSLTHEGGEVVGSYGGSGNTDARNRMSSAIASPLRQEFGAVILKALDKRRSPGPKDQPLGGER